MLWRPQQISKIPQQRPGKRHISEVRHLEELLKTNVSRGEIEIERTNIAIVIIESTESYIGFENSKNSKKLNSFGA